MSNTDEQLVAHRGSESFNAANLQKQRPPPAQPKGIKITTHLFLFVHHLGRLLFDERLYFEPSMRGVRQNILNSSGKIMRAAAESSNRESVVSGLFAARRPPRPQNFAKSQYHHHTDFPYPSTTLPSQLFKYQYLVCLG